MSMKNLVNLVVPEEKLRKEQKLRWIPSIILLWKTRAELLII